MVGHFQGWQNALFNQNMVNPCRLRLVMATEDQPEYFLHGFKQAVGGMRTT